MIEYGKIQYDKNRHRTSIETDFKWLETLLKSKELESLDSFLSLYNLTPNQKNLLRVVKIDNKEFTILYKNREKEIIFIYNQELSNSIKELTNLATKDQLTKALVKGEGEIVLERCFEIFHRFKTPFAIIMCDIDLFKKINDTHGHLVGDFILKELSKLIIDNIRKYDILVRFGGEEFLLVLPNSKAKDAMKVANKLKTIIEKNSFNYQNLKISLTMSFGISTPLKNDKPVDLIKRADEALYLAKRNGRNRIEYL